MSSAISWSLLPHMFCHVLLYSNRLPTASLTEIPTGALRIMASLTASRLLKVSISCSSWEMSLIMQKIPAGESSSLSGTFRQLKSFFPPSPSSKESIDRDDWPLSRAVRSVCRSLSAARAGISEAAVTPSAASGESRPKKSAKDQLQVRNRSWLSFMYTSSCA